MKKLLLLITNYLLILGCSENTDYINKIQDPELFQAAVQNLSDIIVYDIFSPPVASRVYMYPTIAAYEIMAKAYPGQYNSLSGQLTELEKTPEMPEDVNPHLAALLSYNKVAKTLIFSEDKMEVFQKNQAKKIILDQLVPESSSAFLSIPLNNAIETEDAFKQWIHIQNTPF